MANFRPLTDEVDERFEEIRIQYESLTGHTSDNKALNYAVMLAYQKLQETHKQESEAKNARVSATNFEN